jgi:FtsZ-binding cell division protein ZapB
MWKQFFDLFRQVLTVTEDTQRNRLEIKELREQHNALTIFVHKLAAKVEHLDSNNKHEQEKIVLQLQNALLKFEQRLPPAPKE